MKIFPKTFLYTLALLVLIALLANGLIYTLMPAVYTKQKQQDLTLQADKLSQQLETAKRDDIVGLMGGLDSRGQTNIVIEIGGDKYALILWSNGPESEGAVTTYVTVTSTAARLEYLSERLLYAAPGISCEALRRGRLRHHGLLRRHEHLRHHAAHAAQSGSRSWRNRGVQKKLSELYLTHLGQLVTYDDFLNATGLTEEALKLV